MPEFTAKNKEAFDEVVSLLGQCLPANVPYRQYCEDLATESETALSINSLLFLTFIKCCFDTNLSMEDLPDEAFVTVLSRFLDLSIELITVLLGRWKRGSVGQSFTNQSKVKVLMSSLFTIQFSEKLAIVKRRLASETAFDDPSSIVAQYFERKRSEANSLKSCYLLSVMDADVHYENIVASLMANPDSLLAPLSAYPMTSDEEPSFGADTFC